MRTRWHSVARIAKTHGKEGELVAEPLGVVAPVLTKGMLVVFVPPALREERFRTIECVTQGGTAQLIRVHGICEIGAAEKLKGRIVLAREDDLPAEFLLRAPTALIGRRVRDIKAGELGVIREVMVGRGNDVWSVVGPQGELLVPVVDAFVLSWPREGEIVLCLPDDLVNPSKVGPKDCLS